MVTLAIERSSAALFGSRTVFAAAILMTLSTFAKETATVLLDLPKPHLVHVEASSGVAPTPVASVKVPTIRHAIRPLAGLRTGLASWYGKVLHDHRTASGDRFDMFELTAAHRSLPFGSKVKVTDLRNRKSVIVTITDRGLMGTNRIIDLSYAAAERLGMLQAGIDPVRIEVLKPAQIPLAETEPSPEP